jgi:hypothetical protein
MLRLTLPYAQVAQAELRTCSGRAQDVLRRAQECSPSAQVKAAAAHVQTLKQNQRKKKLSMTYVAANKCSHKAECATGKEIRHRVERQCISQALFVNRLTASESYHRSHGVAFHNQKTSTDQANILKAER